MMRGVIVLALCSSCSLGYNATHSHNHPSAADLDLLTPKMRRLAEERQQAPMWCMLGDMGALIGGAGALQAARSFNAPEGMVEPINLAGLATSAIVFASLGVSLWRYGHL